MLSLVLIAVAFVDLRLSQIMGARLDWDVISFGNSPEDDVANGPTLSAGGARGLGPDGAGLCPCGARNPTVGRRRRAGTSASPPGRGVWYALASFVLLGALGLVVANPDKAEGQAGVRLVQTSPLWKRVANRTVSREEFLRSAKALGLGDFEAAGRTYPASARRDLNVVLIFLESSYNKHLSLFGSSEDDPAAALQIQGSDGSVPELLLELRRLNPGAVCHLHGALSGAGF